MFAAECCSQSGTFINFSECRDGQFISIADESLSTVGPRSRTRARACSRPSLERLQSGAHQLVTASLSVNTRHAYATALANFSTFRSNYALPLQWPVPETHIHAYITYLFHNGYAPSTAAMHISAISFQHKINHNFDNTSTFAISKMLEGYKRLRANPDNRMPIMYNTLVAICKILGNICISEYETLLFRAAYRLAFFGLFRVSELVFTSSQQPDQPLQVSDVLCTTKAGQNILRIRQRKAKCNQTGKPYIIDIPAIESTECPLLAMEAFLKIRPHKSVYLFCHINGQPLTRYQFGAVLNKAITALNLPTTHFRTHSFRIGAASWLASKGVSYETIKKMGRWQSNSFLKYIRL